MNELKNERDIIIKVLDGQILLKEASKILGIHKETVNSRIIELAKIDEEIRQKFIKYCKRNNFENINFLVLFREMLEKDCSQSFIASQYDIPTRTISREIEKLKKLEGYESVYSVLKEHAERHIKRRLDKRSLTKEEQKEEYNYEIQLESVLDILPKGEVFTYIDTEDMLSKQIRELEEKISRVEEAKNNGIQWKEIKQIIGIDRSQYNRDRKKLDILKIKYQELMNNKNKDEKESSVQEKMKKFKDSYKNSGDKNEGNLDYNREGQEDYKTNDEGKVDNEENKEL